MILKQSQESEIERLNILLCLFAGGLQTILLATPSTLSKSSAQAETMPANLLHPELPSKVWWAQGA